MNEALRNMKPQYFVYLYLDERERVRYVGYGREDLNVDPGQSRWRFRPLGIPLIYADRLTEVELTPRDFLAVQGANPVPILFVIVSTLDFEDGRAGYEPTHPLGDDQLQDRLERWWQVQRFLSLWAEHPLGSPGLLVGINGSPGRQLVIGSARIDRSA